MVIFAIIMGVLAGLSFLALFFLTIAREEKAKKIAQEELAEYWKLRLGRAA